MHTNINKEKTFIYDDDNDLWDYEKEEQEEQKKRMDELREMQYLEK